VGPPGMMSKRRYADQTLAITSLRTKRESGTVRFDPGGRFARVSGIRAKLTGDSGSVFEALVDP
jgi:hypothetical protein